jgi:hypothetical protein
MVGVTIYDPDVVVTDVILALLGGYLGWRLWRASGQRTLLITGTLLMAGLASAALWGAIFHALFPAGTASLRGFLTWIPVTLSIVVAASAMLDLSLLLLLPRLGPRLRRSIVAAYGVAFAVVVLLVHESFGTIVYFYIPALLLLLIAAGCQAIRDRDTGWALITTGLVLSAGAAGLQQARVAIHPIYFDHNAVYHLVQGLALIVIYLGWRRASLVVVPPRRFGARSPGR